MIGIGVLLIIAIWGIISYIKNMKHCFLIALFLVVSSLINILHTSVYFEDISLIMLFAVIIYDLACGREVFNLRNDPIGIIIIVLLLYYLFNVVLTVVRGDETLLFALKVYRRDLFYLYYFVFKNIELDDIIKTYDPLLKFTILGGILYYLQFVGIHVLENTADVTEVAAGGFPRYTNIPMLGIPFLFYFLVSEKEIKPYYLIFFLGFLIMPMSRGTIIAAMITFAFYLYRMRKYRSLSPYMPMIRKVVILFFLFTPVLLFRFVKDNERGSALQDISSATSIVDSSDFDYNDGGTFTFRIALALERFNYMYSNGVNNLVGVGTIHEQSPNNNFDFYIGTAFHDVDGDFRKQYIDTEDIAYVSHIFRYGLIYLFLFVYFIYLSFSRFSSCMFIHSIGAVGFLFFMMLCINSLSNDVFSFMRTMFVPLLSLAMINTYSPDELSDIAPIK